MCNSLFPVRAVAFAIQLAKIPQTVEKYNAECSHVKLGDDTDGSTRMVLSSPRFCGAVRKHYKLENFRARLAFTDACNSTGMSIPFLELYAADGTFIRAVSVSELNDELSDAVCIEIQHVLLVSKGTHVNMY